MNLSDAVQFTVGSMVASFYVLYEWSSYSVNELEISWLTYRALCVIYYLDQQMHNILTVMSIS